VDREDAYRHSKWLSFMEKRLKLAKNLLKDTGVIFISIDDNEVAQLKLLMDQIFGEENFVNSFYIQVRYAQKTLAEISDYQKLIEQILIYSRTRNGFRPNKPSEEYDLSKFKYRIIEKKKGKEINLGGKKVEIFLPGQYEIFEEKNGSVNLLKATWATGALLRTTAKFFANYLEKRKAIDGLGVLYKVYGIGDDGLGYRYFTGPKRADATKGLFFSGVPIERRKEIESGNGSKKEKPIVNFYDYSADFGNIRHEGGVGFRSGKKPVKLLKNLINLHKNKHALVLDFFAGSGSTGHAVLELNKADGGNRQFILSTNNEENICTDFCYPRLKNVIKGWGKNEGLGGNLKYFKTDFVDAEPTDKNKIKLTRQATEMLCIKEGTFELVQDKGSFKIFKNSKHYTGIIFDQAVIPSFKKAIKDIKGKFSVYVFSLGDETFDEEFTDVKQKVKLSPIPEAILRVYRRIFK
jgi:adenine-specific DNA-methyltransferase